MLFDLSSGLKIAGRGFVRHAMFALRRCTAVGIVTPAPRRKYSLFTGTSLPSSGISRAGSTVRLPSQLISQSPSVCFVVSSSSHSTISTFVPSLPLFGSNSNRAKALLDESEGDSTSSLKDDD